MSRPNTDFFISPAYLVPPIRISLSVKFTAITVSLRQPWRAGSAREARQVDDRVVRDEVLQRRLLGADQHRPDEEVMPCQFGDDADVHPVIGLRPTVQILHEQLVLGGEARRKNPPSARQNAPGSIALLLLPHHTVDSVSASRTMNLSCAERPVCAPVSTTSGPCGRQRPLAARPAPPRRVGAVTRFQCSVARVSIPCAARPPAGIRSLDKASLQMVSHTYVCRCAGM